MKSGFASFSIFSDTISGGCNWYRPGSRVKISRNKEWNYCNIQRKRQIASGRWAFCFSSRNVQTFAPRKFVTGKLAPRERDRVVIMILLYCYIPFICCQLSCDDDHAMQCFMIKEKVKVYSGSEIPNFLLSVVKQPSKWLVARPTLIGPSSPL